MPSRAREPPRRSTICPSAQPWRAKASGQWIVYWGPIRYDNLKALNVGLEGTMNWGWAIIKPFSMGVLRALTARSQSHSQLRFRDYHLQHRGQADPLAADPQVAGLDEEDGRPAAGDSGPSASSTPKIRRP